jgi:hypothetical protein
VQSDTCTQCCGTVGAGAIREAGAGAEANCAPCVDDVLLWISQGTGPYRAVGAFLEVKRPKVVSLRAINHPLNAQADKQQRLRMLPAQRIAYASSDLVHWRRQPVPTNG